LNVSLSEILKITSPIASEVGITAAVQPNDQRLVLFVGGAWSSALVRRTSILIKKIRNRNIARRALT